MGKRNVSASTAQNSNATEAMAIEIFMLSFSFQKESRKRIKNQ
jgi:hypothetical protein